MYCFISFATCWSQRTFHLNLRVTSTLPSVFASFRKMPGISMGGAGLLARFDELLLTCELSWWRHNGRVSGQTIPHALLKVSIVINLAGIQTFTKKTSQNLARQHKNAFYPSWMMARASQYEPASHGITSAVSFFFSKPKAKLNELRMKPIRKW